MDEEFEHDYRQARWWLGSFAVLTLLNLAAWHGTGYVWGPLVGVAFYLGRLDQVTRPAAR